MDHRVGMRFHSLTIVRRINGTKNNKLRYLAKCDCGNLTRVYLSNLHNTKTCGCGRETHGMTGTKEYTAWRSMKDNGLTYRPWKDFEKFLRDVGKAPSPHHWLMRRDAKKGWRTGNVRWVKRSARSDMKKAA